MAYPAVSSITKSREDSDVTTSNAAYPGTVASGDLAILFVGMDGSATAPNFSATGMTGLTSAQYGSVVGQGSAYKVCTGSEGGTTEDWTHGTAQTCSMMVIIAGHDSGTAPSATGAGSSTGASTADPPSHTPSWSSEDTLWIAFGIKNDAPTTVSAYPTNYADNQDSDANTAAAGVSVGIATRELNTAGAEDPGTFTFSSSVAWAAITAAVRPGSSVPVITDVNTTESWTDGATGLVITGTTFVV